MPIPFIAGAIIAAGAAIGAKKAYDAKSDYELAKTYNENSAKLVENTNKNIEAAKEKTNNSLQNLGKTKLNILSGSVYQFVECFEKFKKMNITEGDGIDELRKINADTESFGELRMASIEAKTMISGGIAALGGGALVAIGTYGAVISGIGGATASTGAVIGTLAGVAAKNATLAWLGGGALSAGGFGIAGGTLVLGGLVAAPALAIGGIFAAKKADEAYWESREKYEEAKTYAEQGENVVSNLNAIVSISNQMNNILIKLNSAFEPQVNKMKFIVSECENRIKSGNKITWNDFSVEDKKIIAACAETAKTIKIVLDTAILNENGELQKAAKQCVKMNFAQEFNSTGLQKALNQSSSSGNRAKTLQSGKSVEKSSSAKQSYSPEYMDKIAKLNRCLKVGLINEEEYKQKLVEIEKLK